MFPVRALRKKGLLQFASEVNILPTWVDVGSLINGGGPDAFEELHGSVKHLTSLLWKSTTPVALDTFTRAPHVTPTLLKMKTAFQAYLLHYLWVDESFCSFDV